MFNETINGVDVFEVGKEQLWGWAGWLNRYADCKGVQCEADSLRKGVYVVVSNYSWFGGMQVRPIIWVSFGSKSAALAYLEDITEGLGYSYSAPLCPCDTSYGEDYEIWHVCDDGDLWQAWDAMSEVAAASGETVHDMKDVFAYQLMQEVSKLEERAQEEGAYGCQTNGSYDMCDLLDIYCDDYDAMTKDARDALDELYEKLTVIDHSTCNTRWNALIDEDMTNRLIEHYAPRIWDDAGNVRTASSDE